MFSKFRELILDLFGIALGLFLLVHLILIAVYGRVTVYEKNDWILYPEIAAVVALIALGFERLWGDYRGGSNRGGRP